ncbi:MAG TPA: fumarylacetoacetate hydrolase family protein [Thermoanaerobaculia bacterium]|nr:fumarylacetoacetate hydrolase family protein [Thermoanaerobaculia bacterium]
MKLVTYRDGGRVAVGVVADDRVIDLTSGESGIPDMISLLDAGARGMELARSRAAAGGGKPLAAVELFAPIPRPGKFLGIGLNYAEHAAETGRQPPEHPTVFAKMPTCVNRPGGAIVVPRVSSQVDYEGELAFVVGRRCKNVSRREALEVIAGYTVVNDVSVRDWQRRTSQFTLGKSFDSHGPMGPWLVTADEVGDPHDLELRTWVDGELRQHSSTRHLIFDLPALVETLSTAFTLEPGDVIATGTPSGVGAAMDPPRFLAPGSTVRIEVERVGVLENPVVAEAG